MPWGNETNRMFRIFLYLGMFYWVLPIFVAGLALQIVFNSAVFGISTALLITWGPALWYSLRGDASPENQQITATVTMWLIVWLQRLYSIIFVAMGHPAWMQLSAIPAFFAYMFGAMGVILLVAPSFMKGGATHSYNVQLGVAIVIGVVLGVVSYYLQIVGLDG